MTAAVRDDFITNAREISRRCTPLQGPLRGTYRFATLPYLLEQHEKICRSKLLMYFSVLINFHQVARWHYSEDFFHSMLFEKIVKVLEERPRVNVATTELERYHSDPLLAEHSQSTLQHIKLMPFNIQF
jgi:hypothetical protein